MVEENKEMTPDERRKALRDGQAQLGGAFIGGLIPLLKSEGGLPALNFWKTTITMPDGGTYLLSLAHVDGPKVELK